MFVYLSTPVIDFIGLSNLLFPESPTFNIILFLTSFKEITFMYLFSFLSLFSHFHFIVIFKSLKWKQFNFLRCFESLRLNLVL